MNFRKTFEIERERIYKIPAFFRGRGYKLEKSLPNNYTFKRGAGWIAPLTADIKSCPTRVEVILTEREGNTVQVLVLYDIETMGMVVPRSQQEKIRAELDSLYVSTKTK